jgi:hypothetical protein
MTEGPSDTLSDKAPVADLQSRLISPCLIQDGKNVSPSVPDLFKRLLLFETYILQSVRFREFIPLVHTIGIHNVLALLSSGALQLECDPTQIVNIGQLPDGPTYSRGKPALPFLSYAFSILKVPHYNEYLVRSLQQVRRELYGYVVTADLAKLEAALLNALQPPPENTGLMASRGHDADLRANSPVLRKALALLLSKTKRLPVLESQIEVRMIPLDDTDFRAESNLASFGLSAEEQHRIIERALLANGGLNSRIENMSNYNALSGFIDGDLPLFSGRLDVLTAALSPGDRVKTFDRVIRIRELPSLELVPPDHRFDVERFLEVRASKECSEFRTWLRTVGRDTDEEIHERVDTVRTRLGPYVHGTSGKAARIAISVITGLIPLFGAALGAGWSVVDSYLLERVFPVSGPTVFLSRDYNSLFKPSRPDPS